MRATENEPAFAIPLRAFSLPHLSTKTQTTDLQSTKALDPL